MAAKSPSTSRILLVDGHSIAFRAYYALPVSLQDEAGRPANAFYGFWNILLRVVRDFAPTHLAVTFDVGRPFRENLFAGYKASRDAGPEDLEPQVEHVRTVLGSLRAPLFECAGFEADDLLATLAGQAQRAGMEVEVLSGDLDVVQLATEGVRIIAPGRTFAEPVLYDEDRVRERFGVGPSRVRDWKALVGDTSDDVPGVAGIGKKTATELLQRFGSLTEIYANLGAIDSVRVRNALAAGQASAELSLRLVTLRDDAPVTLDGEVARLDQFDRDAARSTVQSLGFRSLADRIAKI